MFMPYEIDEEKLKAATENEKFSLGKFVNSLVTDFFEMISIFGAALLSLLIGLAGVAVVIAIFGGFLGILVFGWRQLVQ